MQLQGLVVGLGNPGKEYENTRHNFGFMLIETVLGIFEKEGFARCLSGKNDKYRLWRCGSPRLGGEWLLCTPLTFMNKSGEAVQRIAAYYQISSEAILVLHDELDLPLGRLKLKKGGGNAGHNGLRSIQQLLGTPDFYRLRLGIGKPAHSPGASYVLSRFSAAEQKCLQETLDGAAKGIFLFLSEGEKSAQQFINSFAPETAPSPLLP